MPDCFRHSARATAAAFCKINWWENAVRVSRESSINLFAHYTWRRSSRKHILYYHRWVMRDRALLKVLMCESVSVFSLNICWALFTHRTWHLNNQNGFFLSNLNMCVILGPLGPSNTNMKNQFNGSARAASRNIFALFWRTITWICVAKPRSIVT